MYRQMGAFPCDNEQLLADGCLLCSYCIDFMVMPSGFVYMFSGSDFVHTVYTVFQKAITLTFRSTLRPTIFNKFTACYNKCVKKFFGYRRMDSMTGILLDLSLPTVNTILHNSRILFIEHCTNSNNDIVRFLNSVGL